MQIFYKNNIKIYNFFSKTLIFFIVRLTLIPPNASAPTIVFVCRAESNILFLHKLLHVNRESFSHPSDLENSRFAINLKNYVKRIF